MENKSLKFAILCVIGGVLVFVLAQVKDKDININLGGNEESLINSQGENQGNASCPGITFVGDGFCDDDLNTEECNFDLGDCCKASSDRTLCEECLCKSNMTHQGNACLTQYLCHNDIYKIGNGDCNLLLNTEPCFFDAGDCCMYETGQCVNSTNYCINELIGDGHCHDFNNSPFCGYDGGDCCNFEKDWSEDHGVTCCDCRCKYLEESVMDQIFYPVG